LFPPLERALRETRPEAVTLNSREAWSFIGEAAPLLADAGIGLLLPAELTRSGQRRLKLRMRVGERAGSAAGGDGGAALSLDEMLTFSWEAELAGENVSLAELRALAKLKAPLVRYRGQWVALDPAELAQAQRLLADGGGSLTVPEALSY